MFVIETIIENSLYAIKYGDTVVDEFENNEFEEDYKKPNEFRRLFNNWSDPEYLDAFFYKHRDDLQKEFYDFISIEDAITQTRKESMRLEKRIKEIAEKGNENDFQSLQTLFKPLYKREEELINIPSHQRSKAYGDCHKSWLRIYAIRIEKNVFIITGGAIKLTENMNEREHLLKELEKIKMVKQFLINEQIIDNDSIIELLEL